MAGFPEVLSDYSFLPVVYTRLYHYTYILLAKYVHIFFSENLWTVWLFN